MNRIFISTILAVSALFANAECEIGLGVSPFSGGDDVPEAVTRQLESRIKMALTRIGVAAGDFDCQFFITGRFDHEFTQQAAGPGGKVLVKTNLQLAICDGENKKVFATETFSLKGVGSTDQQALTRALSTVGANNQPFVNFVESAKKKIIKYFDDNYPTYLSKAKKALTQRDFEMALFWSMQVPECCTGYNEASQLSDEVFRSYVEYSGDKALTAAEAAWNTNPTSEGAAEAYEHLKTIDPGYSKYSQVKALGQKMGKSIKADIDFETKEKYHDAMDFNRRKLDAYKEILVAKAQNQPQTIIKNNWIAW